MDWMTTLKSLAPTVASAFLGPLGGIAVAAVGGLLGVPDATQDKIGKFIQQGRMTSEQVATLQTLEMGYIERERELGFKYSELEFKDRDSARRANVDGGTQKHLFWMSLVLLCATLGSEMFVLFYGYPPSVPDIVVGRVLGLMDSVALMVLAYWYGSSSGSASKQQLLATAATK